MNRFLIAVLSAFPGAAAAGSWSGHADLGFTETSGNSDTSSLNAGVGAAYATGRWKHSLEVAALRNEDSGQINAERYEATAKSKYALSEISYAFGQLDWERDEFAGVFERTSQTVGYGRTLIYSEPHTLIGEISAGATQVEFKDGSKESGPIARLGFDYDWLISETATFTEDLSVESGGVNTYIESVTGLKLNVVGSLFAKLTCGCAKVIEVTRGIQGVIIVVPNCWSCAS